MASKENRKYIVGKVLSNKMEKTCIVRVTRVYSHPTYKKEVTAHKKYKVHDELGQAQVGDNVEVYEGRPVSKEKYMYLHRVIK